MYGVQNTSTLHFSTFTTSVTVHFKLLSSGYWITLLQSVRCVACLIGSIHSRK